MPNSVGPSTSLPLVPTYSELRNHTASIATPSARVTTATGRPRMRSAGSTITTPTTVAPRAASSGAIGNGMSRSVVSGPRMKPATPARVSWASEICPA